ncbi:phytanoyl-CoA dioxygenase family protein [Winogradskyella sp. DF17]|uniref:Phytanoyl-CoA dioxygenase family protein n=1 Tax=Winogradskyella pelagia TaxID=2819984 RepID=A0ABS3SYU5_9FLAO|nr:phytanoyl-CoA dioxygenase family protein [Winogradskyella sp. DF17]
MNIGDETYQLSTKQVEDFQKDGHILIESLSLQQEMVFFQPIIKAACSQLNTETRKLQDRDTYSKAFLQIMNLWTQNEKVKKFVFAKRFADVAARLLGVDKVRLYHDQALFKEPNGGYTPWHQDQYYWPLDTNKTITMWMPLVDISEDMGMLTFASGSHKLGEVKSEAISDDTEAIFEAHIKKHGFTLQCAKVMKAGDATFHSGWTIHGAGPNKSRDQMREVMTVIYYADGAKIQSPGNKHQKTDLDKWLGNKSVGQFADSSSNPILN